MGEAALEAAKKHPHMLPNDEQIEIDYEVKHGTKHLTKEQYNEIKAKVEAEAKEEAKQIIEDAKAEAQQTIAGAQAAAEESVNTYIDSRQAEIETAEAKERIAKAKQKTAETKQEKAEAEYKTALSTLTDDMAMYRRLLKAKDIIEEKINSNIDNGNWVDFLVKTGHEDLIEKHRQFELEKAMKIAETNEPTQEEKMARIYQLSQEIDDCGDINYMIDSMGIDRTLEYLETEYIIQNGKDI